ncbi:ras GTPase-activating-like protein rng2 [Aspergillus udagawae]|uniref:Ras GTPase-activating-like protein rng2 n=1 Tax=Aspergillus udagawae TaxID=91492 RepID=A0ABQ1A9E7_9EURO|nr:ras GTPase-activating-like protein rng2 [Aspergillus udagawae]GFG10468.1 ras GTPase-activating-like protein rng2 [Aspergillus udagawae]GFG25739.1 ras GTPase-activating-like protein rng2 [Aspergillus udagawae]
MASQPIFPRRTQTDLPQHTSSPLRHGSTASTSSSVYSLSSNSQAPSRTSTVSSNASIGSASRTGHRRGKSELNSTTLGTMVKDTSEGGSWTSAATTYENVRRSLRPLPQAPNAAPPTNKTSVYRHTRSQTVDNPQYWKENRPQTPDSRHPHSLESDRLSERQSLNSQSPPRRNSVQPGSPHAISPHSRPHMRPHHSHSLSNPLPPPLTTTLSTPELETFKKSSTGHLRTLSKFAKSGETEEFALETYSPSVVGLQGRRRLKRAGSVAGAQGSRAARKQNASAWAAGNWMDKQRQFLQAYEYLCHIGEAKEWIEEVIQKQIPPIVQLEEALRDGVTLAEVVQAMYPNRTFRIFRHPKLQYRHSDNIALFFRFLDEVELPELFRFELIDLYEKKNIPKVIHCVHALSWLLFKKGLVDFRMGNLVGQLEFEHHELEQTQKGLDKSGVSMPSFSGMAANFGAEPEPEPEPEPETEEERIERELHENEMSITEFQAQIKGAMLRLKLGNVMNELWDFEPFLVDLQSRLRGDWARQVIQYRLSMRSFAVNLQAACRGFIVRSRQQGDREWCQAQELDVLRLQTLIRGAKARTQVQYLRSRTRKEESGIKQVQAAIRGALQRKKVCAVYEDTRATEPRVIALQAAVRGALCRILISKQHDETQCAEDGITQLQSLIRGAHFRRQLSAQQDDIKNTGDNVQQLQAAIRGMLTRKAIIQLKSSLAEEIPSVISIQAGARALAARDRYSQLTDALAKTENECITLQAFVRGEAVRGHLNSLRQALGEHTLSIIGLQSILRAKGVRDALGAQKAALVQEEGSVLQLQSAARASILRIRLEADAEALRAQEHMIVDLQALSRAAILRIRVGAVLDELESCEDEVSQLQAHIRAMIVRVDVGQDLADLAAEEELITDLQSRMRGHIIRSKFEEKRQYYRANMERVIKAQSIVRGRIQGQAYKSLTTGKNPPVNTVKGFVHLLNDSEFDFDEEIEFERLRKLVVQQVRQNELAEQYISQLDIKIALLVKNKITLDEVVKHQKHFGGHVGSLLSNADISSKDPFDLKALNKTSRKKLEHYQVLFFLLQTQSQYLAKLFRRLRELNTPEKEYERIRHLMMGLFGYSQKRREEYYLIKLLSRSAKEEIESFDSLHEYLRCNSFWNKLFASYIKSPRDRKFMRDVLGPLVKENVVENPELDLESDPIQIYRSAINNEELRTGRRSRRPLDLPREEAIRDPETRATFIQNLQDLRDIADQFFTALEELLYRMPFGIRYISQQMYECLLSRFPGEDPGFILQAVGHWVWRNYFQPAMVEPEKYGVIDRGLTQEQKRNLSEIAKVVAQVASGRLFGTENVYLQPLNSYVADSIQRLGQIWGDMVSVQDAEEYFDIDEFNDLYAKTKPTLYIKMADIFSIHQLVASEINYICPHPDDILREIIRDLGNVKTNENELMSVNSSEINLTLNPKLAQVEDPEADVKALFMETKRCVLYIIRVQTGTNLMEIMVKPPTEEDEERWMTLVRDELTATTSQRSAYSEASTLVDIASMTYSELKRTALENILQLERTGKIRRDNHYQDLLNAIAIDIRTKHRRRIQRQREVESARLTLGRLNDQAGWLEQQLKTYNDYIEQAMVTLQNKKGKKRFLMPFTKQWDHQRELQKSGKVFKFGSYKYSARNLADKGVLVYWKGYSERQWDRVDLTISSNEVGVFTLDGSSGPMMVPGANAQVPLDDLLQAQFNNMQFMDFFDGHLRVNVNLFLHLIMRKFYNE